MTSNVNKINAYRNGLTLEWLDDELEHARTEDWRRTVELLEAVRDEAVFEAVLAENLVVGRPGKTA